MSPPRINSNEPSLLLDIYQEVSRLSGNITLLMADRTEAAMDRREINARLALVDARLAELSLAEATVRRIEPVVKRLESAQDQARGAIWIARVLWALGGALVGIGVFILQRLK